MSANLGGLQSRDVTLPGLAGLPLFQVENTTFGQYSPGFQAIRLQPELCHVRPPICHEKPVSEEHQRNAEGTRLLTLTKGQFAIVDAADYERLAAHKWHAYRRRRDKTFYAVRSVPNPRIPGGRTKVFLHREIMGSASDIDHRDGNGLNNRRQNLRPATLAENNRNIGKPRHGVTSRYKGVSWHPGGQKFQATVRYCSKNYYLGLFKTEEEAAWTYDREARLRFGAFARTNFPPPPAVIDWMPA